MLLHLGGKARQHGYMRYHRYVPVYTSIMIPDIPGTRILEVYDIGQGEYRASRRRPLPKLDWTDDIEAPSVATFFRQCLSIQACGSHGSSGPSGPPSIELIAPLYRSLLSLDSPAAVAASTQLQLIGLRPPLVL